MIRKLTLSVLMLFALHSVAQAQACGEDIVKQRIKAAIPPITENLLIMFHSGHHGKEHIAAQVPALYWLGVQARK